MPAKGKKKKKRRFGESDNSDDSDYEEVVSKLPQLRTRPSDVVSKPKKKTKRKQSPQKDKRTEDPNHPVNWFNPQVSQALWFPSSPSFNKSDFHFRGRHKTWCGKNKKKPRQQKEKAIIQTISNIKKFHPIKKKIFKPLMTSWFDVGDICNQPTIKSSFLKSSKVIELEKGLSQISVIEDGPVNSSVKIRLYPTTEQRASLEQMFSTQRAIYNKLVASSRADVASKMSLTNLEKRYRPISKLKTMAKYFKNNKKALKRHMEPRDEVRDSAFHDFKKAVSSSRSRYYKQMDKDEKTTYPALKFKSKFDRSNTIQIEARSISIEKKKFVRFHPRFFKFKKGEGIEIRESLPELKHAVRLQRLREGDYYLCIPRFIQVEKTKSERVCAIDPGVRNFITVYDPEGRTFSVKDAYKRLRRSFIAVDKFKSHLARWENYSKKESVMHTKTNREQKNHKKKKKKKTKYHRVRYRMRRLIRFTLRHITRLVKDMHQKVSSWLSDNYNIVLLPEFQTSKMARKYEEEVALDANPFIDEFRPFNRSRRKISSSTVRSMMALAHYQFKKLLMYKMERRGGRVVICNEAYTSMTCSNCGSIRRNLGGSKVYRCSSCSFVHDRDINAAKNIFHKNVNLILPEIPAPESPASLLAL